MSKLKIALLLGGKSGEREVSLKTGGIIYNALDKDKYEVHKYDPKTDLIKLVKDIEKNKIDLVFPALHGPFGEDGKIQGMLDMLEVPYVFSGCLASALAMHKTKTKIIANSIGVLTAPYLVLSDVNVNKVEEGIGLPVVVKPQELGSSVGISVAKTREELKTALELALSFDREVLVEKYISGRELTVTVMGQFGRGNALPVIEIRPKVSEWFDFKAKYETGGSEEICPAQISDSIRDTVQKKAVKIFNGLGCKDLARADFIWVEEDNKFYFLEINTIPGMTATSLAPQAAKASGLEFSEFLDKLISYNLKN